MGHENGKKIKKVDHLQYFTELLIRFCSRFGQQTPVWKRSKRW
jgi:hypothetical protein